MATSAMLVPAGPIRRVTADAGFDQQQLYSLGLAHVQRLASRIWTDYNVHDPGCTALELLSYALTDLRARAELPVEDLLTVDGHTNDGLSGQFFTARQILTAAPLTRWDYRKLLIDLPGVKNAWVQPASRTFYADPVAATLSREPTLLPGIRAVPIRGLYDVRVEFMETVDTPAAQQEVLERVRAVLDANRNLCEEFVTVAGVERQSFVLCAELELAPDADVTAVTAEVLYRVQRYLAPPVRSYSLSEMLERYSAPEIFDGPALTSGFIDDRELAAAELRTEIRLSDVISIVMDIPAVRAVRDLLISPQDSDAPPAQRWKIAVDAGKQPSLNRSRSRLVCYKGSMPVDAAPAAVDVEYAQLVERERQRLEGEHPQDLDLPVPEGRDHHAGVYYSVQNHFPSIYGLSDDWRAVPDATLSEALKRRRALAYQLKGYLLFFDQLMANYCAQLHGLRDLFSTDPAVRRTYFAQIVDSFTSSANIYAGAAPAALGQLVEDDNAAIERRNRFLDHLIARFAERFHDYASIMRSAFAASPESLIGPKCQFLQNYPEISRERGLAYNRTKTGTGARWNSSNVSGFERRTARLLDIRNWWRRNLSELPYQIYPEVDTTPGDEFRFRVRDGTTGEILLSSTTHYDTAAAGQAELQRAMQFAQLPQGYERKVASDGRFYFNVVDGTGAVIARRIAYFDTAAQRDAAIDYLMVAISTNVEQGPRAGEGMYVIENILLLPTGPDDPFLPICVDPNCTECADDDPYSYRVHVALPAYAGRFATMEFRRFAEAVIREEMPAHVLPKVCWISRDDMQKLEQAYHEWIDLTPGSPAAERKAKLATFIAVLYSVKNVYPPQQLRGCDGEETQPKFILGQTAIGSGGAAEPVP